nr:reverse transcriptase domain-containing protein [Tanacetum cinerariifolium]
MENARVWFDDLLTGSIDSYDDLKKAFLEKYLQQKKCIKDPIELNNIKQRDGESTEDFVKSKRVTRSKISRKEEFRTSRGHKGRKIDLPTTHLIGYNGEIIWPIGQIQLLVRIGDEEHSALAWMNFVVVRSPSQYNRIIRRPGVRKLQAVPSTAHEMLKLSVEGGVIILKSSRQKKTGQAADRNKAIHEKVKKLVEAGIMKEVHYHDWLSNPVMGLVDKAFHKQIGRNLKVYVDDLVIKSRTKAEVVRDIEEMFKTLREINMKLNPKKYTFGVEKGMFLGYKVNNKRLKVCPDKVDAVLSLPSPKFLKDVQKLNGKLASLNRFLAKSAKKSLPFFKTYKKCTKKNDFHWTIEAEEAFKQMKQLIAELPMLTAPMEKEELTVYLATAKETISAVLMTKKEAKQMPIYFVSKALRDLIVERPKEDSLDTLMEVEEELLEPWILFTDESSCTDGSRAGLILTNPERVEFTYALRFRFDAINNEAKYDALIAGLKIAEQIDVKNLKANVDSRLVANQVNGTYVAKEVDMIRYLEKVRKLTSSFKAFSIRQVRRSENKKADALSKIAFTSFAHLSKQVLVEELKDKSISEVEILVIVKEEEDTWMSLIFEYLKEEILSTDVKKARAVRHKSQQFVVINGTLYKNLFLDHGYGA